MDSILKITLKSKLGDIHKSCWNILVGRGIQNSDVARNQKVEVSQIRVEIPTWGGGYKKWPKKIGRLLWTAPDFALLWKTSVFYPLVLSMTSMHGVRWTGRRPFSTLLIASKSSFSVIRSCFTTYDGVSVVIFQLNRNKSNTTSCCYCETEFVSMYTYM